MVNVKSKLQRRQKKERQTPDERKHLGFVERHKDYIQRSSAHKENREKQKQYIIAAENRNPDEYTFEMERYIHGGIFGIKEKKKDFEHENDVIPEVRILASIKQNKRSIEQLQAELFDAYGTKNEDVQQLIDEIQQKVDKFEAELTRRHQVKMEQDKRKKIEYYDEKLEKTVKKYVLQRKK
uniref:U3 small nucleolar RNA-associated protein 11 n=1 Tax=Trepomonas sp. PC1 TaxID=1076344 RepID=A0A146KAF0_9EUKA|eukprot:JAP93537.1 U3 small nucleolar RNA-associated protein 11 [Trepomonas sp. PC1]